MLDPRPALFFLGRALRREYYDLIAPLRGRSDIPENHLLRLVAYVLVGLVLLSLGSASTRAVSAAADGAVVLSARMATQRKISLDLGNQWRYHPGDDRAWSAKELDDASWATLGDTHLTNVDRGSWPGIGWFRLHFAIDPDLVGVPFFLQLRQLGASEAFLDGDYVRNYGTIGSSALEDVPFDDRTVPPQVVFTRPGEHVLALRYAYRLKPGMAPAPDFGFICWLEVIEPPPGQSPVAWTTAPGDLWTCALAGVLVALGLSHCLSFWFDRRRRFQLFLGVSSIAGGLFAGLVAWSPPLGQTAPWLAAVATSVTLGVAATSFAAFLALRLSSSRNLRSVWFAPAVWLVVPLLARRRGDERLVAIGMTVLAGAVAYVWMKRLWRVAPDRDEVKYTRRATWSLLASGVCLLVGGMFLQVRTLFGSLAGLLALAPMLLLTGRFAYRTAVARRALEKKVKAYTTLPAHANPTLRPAEIVPRREDHSREPMTDDDVGSAGEPASEVDDQADTAADASEDDRGDSERQGEPLAVPDEPLES